MWSARSHVKLDEFLSAVLSPIKSNIRQLYFDGLLVVLWGSMVIKSVNFSAQYKCEINDKLTGLFLQW